MSKPVRILCLGDSITAGAPGFKSPIEHRPSGSGDKQSQYEYWIKLRHPEWELFNEGVSGQRTDQIARRFEGAYQRNQPTAVILIAGVNDLYQGYETAHVKSFLEKISKQALDHHLALMICTILPFDLSSKEVRTNMHELNEWIREYTAKNNILFCDAFKVMENPSMPDTLISTEDSIHPDREGYRKLGNAICDVLERSHFDQS